MHRRPPSIRREPGHPSRADLLDDPADFGGKSRGVTGTGAPSAPSGALPRPLPGAPPAGATASTPSSRPEHRGSSTLPRRPPPVATDPGYPDQRTLALLHRQGSVPVMALVGAAIVLAAGGVATWMLTRAPAPPAVAAPLPGAMLPVPPVPPAPTAPAAPATPEAPLGGIEITCAPEAPIAGGIRAPEPPPAAPIAPAVPEGRLAGEVMAPVPPALTPVPAKPALPEQPLPGEPPAILPAASLAGDVAAPEPPPRLAPAPAR